MISEDSDIPRPSFYKLRQLESPRGFFEALEQVDFVVRREHRLGNLWNTRYMKVSYQSMPKKALFGGGNHVERNLKGRNRRCTELKDNDYMARHSTAVVEPLDNNPVAEQTKQIDDQNNRRLSTEEESKPIRDLIVSFQNSIHAEDSQNEDCDDDGIGIEDFSGNQNITSSPSQSKDQRNSPVSELVVGPHNSSTQRRFSESNSEQSVSRDTGTLDIIISADPDGSTTSGLHNVSTASLAKPVAMSAAEIARLNLDYPSGSLKSINPSSDAIEKYHVR